VAFSYHLHWQKEAIDEKEGEKEGEKERYKLK
jgi:hypothetical protein